MMSMNKNVFMRPGHLYHGDMEYYERYSLTLRMERLAYNVSLLRDACGQSKRKVLYSVSCKC